MFHHAATSRYTLYPRRRRRLERPAARGEHGGQLLDAVPVPVAVGHVGGDVGVHRGRHPSARETGVGT